MLDYCTYNSLSYNVVDRLKKKKKKENLWISWYEVISNLPEWPDFPTLNVLNGCHTACPTTHHLLSPPFSNPSSFFPTAVRGSVIQLHGAGLGDMRVCGVEEKMSPQRAPVQLNENVSSRLCMSPTFILFSFFLFLFPFALLSPPCAGNSDPPLDANLGNSHRSRTTKT